MTDGVARPWSSDEYVPSVRTGVATVEFGHECVAWATPSIRPVYLDPVASVIRQIIDGHASVADLVDDVHDVLGLDEVVARAQIERTITTLWGAGMLVDSPPRDEAAAGLEIFTDPPND